MTHPRGDIRIQIDGEEKNLRLTLGVLADIEEALGGGSLERLQERLKNPSVTDIIFILHALIGGGGAQLSLEALKASDINLAEASAAIAKAFETLSEAPGKRLSGEV